LAAKGFSTSRILLERQIDIRYVGQSYEITLPFSAGYDRAFHKTTRACTDTRTPRVPSKSWAVRVRAAGITQKPKLPFQRPRRMFRPPPAQKRPGRFSGKSYSVASYRWSDLVPGAAASGPAIVTT
jgi:N-methylhydantoinase A/oxoprolinase/acetone carboxylase beta subunit